MKTTTLLFLATILSSCAAAPPQPIHYVITGPASPDLSDPIRYAVRLTVETPEASFTRSGVMIDPRGYVLTTYSAVGNTTEGEGIPGELFADGQNIRVQLFDSPFLPSEREYLAEVVRGDLRLNFALLRIVSDVEGAALDPELRFPSVDLDHVSERFGLAAMGWMVGAHATHRSPLIDLMSFTHCWANSSGALSACSGWTFAPSMDGAGMFDGDGRLLAIGMSPRVYRPINRLPAAWRQALAQGPIDNQELSGIDVLRDGEWVEVTPVGDLVAAPSEESSYRREAEGGGQTYYFRVESSSPGTVRAVPPMRIRVSQGGRALAMGNGEVFVSGAPRTMVAVTVPDAEDPRGLFLRVQFEPNRRAQ